MSDENQDQEITTWEGMAGKRPVQVDIVQGDFKFPAEWAEMYDAHAARAPEGKTPALIGQIGERRFVFMSLAHLWTLLAQSAPAEQQPARRKTSRPIQRKDKKWRK